MSIQNCKLKGQAREIVENVRQYFERQCGSVTKSIELTAEATKISTATVYRIKKEKIQHSADNPGKLLSTPDKKRVKKSPVTNIDSFDKTAIRNHIYSYYMRKEHPTMAKLLKSLAENDIFQGCRESLDKILKIHLGFKFKKFNGRKVLKERKDIRYWRTKYLRTILHEIEPHSNIVWTDETWVNANHTVKKCWTDESLNSTPKQPLGKGGRLILTHAGGSNGFIEGAKEIFRSKKTGDYHEEMNFDHFIKWFENNLLLKLNEPSVIVLDNAPYHSKVLNPAPTSNNSKEDMISWLRNTAGVAVDNSLRKEELYNMVKNHKVLIGRRYIVDELALKHGHRVVRLPPYHCEYNPIELIWANVKGFVARNNVSFTMADTEKLTHEAIERITAEDWRKAVDHCMELCRQAWEIDGSLSVLVPQVIITGDDSESDSDEDDSDDENIKPLQ